MRNQESSMLLGKLTFMMSSGQDISSMRGTGDRAQEKSRIFSGTW